MSNSIFHTARTRLWRGLAAVAAAAVIAAGVTATSPEPTAAAPAVAPMANRSCSISHTLGGAQYVNANVTLAASEEQLFSRSANHLAPSGSTMKLVTAIATLRILGPEYRILTHLYEGTKPGSFIVRGAGDPTIASGWSNTYWGAPTLIALANSAKARGATSVSMDPWFYSGPNWHPGWNPVERANGYMAPMEGFMVDGGRINPHDSTSARVENPAWIGGVKFSQLTGARFDPSIGVKPGSQPVGTIASAPVSTMVHQMLQQSDNVLAEALGRQVAARLGLAPSYYGTTVALRAVMASVGADVSGIDASDASGLSRWSRMTPVFTDKVLQLIQNGNSGSNVIVGMLPRNQVSGTLAGRLGGVAPNFVAAKTGWVDYGYSMAGFMWAPDGQLLRFTFTAWKDMWGGYVGVGTRDALDQMVTAAWRCGANLSNR